MQALLQANGVNVDDERIVSVDDAASKADALAALRERHAGATVRYVDDSVDDLRAVAADARLLSVRTFYAVWVLHAGAGGAGRRDAARAHARVEPRSRGRARDASQGRDDHVKARDYVILEAGSKPVRAKATLSAGNTPK